MLSPKPFDIYVIDRVVFGVPMQSMTIPDVNDYFQAIIHSSSNLTQWVLFENPQTTAIYTIEASAVIIKNYQKLTNHGCVGIALQLSNIVARFIRNPTMASMEIPFLASMNQIELAHFVSNIADEIEQIQAK